MEKFIDVKKLIVSKNKKLLKWLPGFFIKWIERIVHQDEANEFMSRHHNDDSNDFCRAIVEEFNLELNLDGLDKIPLPPQSIIFASNHPFGGLDAIAIVDLLKDVRPDIKFIVNDLLMNLKTMKDRFIGVNKVGKNASKSLQMVEDQFARGPATFVFPAGLVSRKTKGRIEDLEWKKTFVTKAKKYGKPVVPVHIDGRLTNRFYRLANLRKFLGIKLNIEMFFLVDELYKQKDVRIDIVIGDPIMPDTFTRERSDKEWAQWVKEKVYQLKKA
ncbi:MAG: 1-acyl-sn-glycerol-3-phosphate acyltransferase [Cyclobacteriaceae bacterium]